MRVPIRTIAIGLAAVVGGLLLLRRDIDATAVAQGSERPASPPGVVVICLDTLRADALALDSGRPVRMPRLERFARESVAFADAQSSAAWTVPSVTSFLTGLEPEHTGVFGLPQSVRPLPRSVPTLAKSLAAAGWSTTSITSSGWTGPEATALLGFADGLVGLDRNPEAVLTAWDRRRAKDQPFLLFLHSLAAHEPYLDKDLGASRAPLAEVADSALAASVRRFESAELERLRGIGARLDAGRTPSYDECAWMYGLRVGSSISHDRFFSELAGLSKTSRQALYGSVQRWLDDAAERDPRTLALGNELKPLYDAGLQSADRIFARILDGLDALALPPDTVIIVVGDHGESFGEHATLGHGRRLFDEVLRVPLLVRARGRAGAARVVHGLVGLVDLAPTILAWVGLPTRGLDGMTLFEADATNDARRAADRVIRSVEERQTFGADGERVVRLASFRTARARCIVQRDAGSGRTMSADVYDLVADPLEQHPIPFRSLPSPSEFGAAFDAAAKDAGLVPAAGAVSIPSEPPTHD